MNSLRSKEALKIIKSAFFTKNTCVFAQKSPCHELKLESFVIEMSNCREVLLTSFYTTDKLVTGRIILAV